MVGLLLKKKGFAAGFDVGFLDGLAVGLLVGLTDGSYVGEGEKICGIIFRGTNKLQKCKSLDFDTIFILAQEYESQLVRLLQ
jgi:hypothetical protein